MGLVSHEYGEMGRGMIFGKKTKKLFEYDPKELDLGMLSHLQASLVAKLVLVHDELLARNRKLIELSGGLDKVEKPQAALAKEADHVEQLNDILKFELKRITRPASQNSN